MSKKSSQKKRKHKVKVATLNKNKNTNKIVIKIDNSGKRVKHKRRAKKRAPLLSAEDATVVAPIVQPRIYSDIGDVTKLIEQRNDAMKKQRELYAEQGQKLGSSVISVPEETTTTINTSTLPTVRSPDDIEPISTSRLGLTLPPVDYETASEGISTPGDLPSPPAVGRFSTFISGLDLATPFKAPKGTPAAVRKLKDEVKATKPTALRIFQKFDDDKDVVDSEDASFQKFQQWAILNGNIKINQRNYISDYSLSSLENYFYKRFD